MGNLKIVKGKNMPGNSAAANEFGQTAKAVRVIRSAFHKLVKELDDPGNTGRLTAKLLQVVQSDPIHGSGLRTVADGDITYLEGFDFSIKHQLRQLLYARFDTDIHRGTGQCIVHLPTFTPQLHMHIPDNQTHVVFFAAAAEVNFERESFVADVVKSDYLNIQEPVSLMLQPMIPKDSQCPLLLTLGLQFYHVINGYSYSMGNRVISSLSIVQAAGAPTSCRKRKTGTWSVCCTEQANLCNEPMFANVLQHGPDQ
jgi:hypothetical protein